MCLQLDMNFNMGNKNEPGEYNWNSLPAQLFKAYRLNDLHSSVVCRRARIAIPLGVIIAQRNFDTQYYLWNSSTDTYSHTKSRTQVKQPHKGSV